MRRIPLSPHDGDSRIWTLDRCKVVSLLSQDGSLDSKKEGGGVTFFYKKNPKIVTLLGFYGVILVGCGVYDDIPLPVPTEGAQAVSEEPNQNNGKVAALSELGGVSKYKIGIRGATQPFYRAESTGDGKAKGALLQFNRDAFAKDFELMIEPAELPLAQMRAELGTSGSVQLISPMVRFGTTPLMDPGGTVTIGIPLVNGAAHPLAANFAILGLVSNVGEGGTNEIVWIPKDRIKFFATRMSFEATKFGIYGLVAVDPPITSLLSLTSKRQPVQYGLSGLYRVSVAGLPKPSAGVTTPPGSYVVSPDLSIKATVSGPEIVEYKFEFRKEKTDCKDVKFGVWTAVKKAITLKLGDNGVKTLCVVGKNAAGRETDLFQFTWIKQTPKSYVTIDGKNTVEFALGESKTVTLKVTGAKAKNIRVSGLGNGFEFLGAKFPGTGGTCKKGGEDKTCSLVFNLKAKTAGTYSTTAQITYADGSEDKSLNLKLKATLQ